MGSLDSITAGDVFDVEVGEAPITKPLKLVGVVLDFCYLDHEPSDMALILEWF